MAITAVTQEYTPGSRRNSRKTVRLLISMTFGPIPLHFIQRNSIFPIKHVRSLDLIPGTPESPQEHCHKSRRTLMSPQECEIAQCTTNQIKMKTDSTSLAPESS